MDQYKDLHATQLFCDRCKRAVPVYEKLLLIIPGQNLYEYICSQCGNSLGKREEPDADNMRISLVTPQSRRRR